MIVVEVPARTLQDEIELLMTTSMTREQDSLMANGAIIALHALLSGSPKLSTFLAEANEARLFN